MALIVGLCKVIDLNFSCIYGMSVQYCRLLLMWIIYTTHKRYRSEISILFMYCVISKTLERLSFFEYDFVFRAFRFGFGVKICSKMRKTTFFSIWRAACRSQWINMKRWSQILIIIAYLKNRWIVCIKLLVSVSIQYLYTVVYTLHKVKHPINRWLLVSPTPHIELHQILSTAL